MAYGMYRGEIKRASTYRTEKEVPPQIRIIKNGGIFFNKGAIQLMGITGPCFCTFYYDKQQKRVGFRFTKRRTAVYMRRVIYKNNVTSNVSGQGFFNYHNIDCSISKVYTPWYDEQAKLFVIQLNEVEEAHDV